MKLNRFGIEIPLQSRLPGGHFRVRFALGQSFGQAAALQADWPSRHPGQPWVIKIIIPNRFPQPA